MATKTFKEAYGVLQRHAQTLRDQQEPNIDDLLTIVTQSVDAYKVCKERIDAVEKALDKALDKALGEAGAVAKKSSRAPKAALPATPDAENGDIPF